MQSPWLDQLEQRVRQWQHLNAEEKMKRSGRAAAAAAKKSNKLRLPGKCLIMW